VVERTILTVKELMDLELPELLEKLTGRVGIAAALRLSLGPVSFYIQLRSFRGVHVFFPGEDMSVYITSWGDGVGGMLDSKGVESVISLALCHWATVGLTHLCKPTLTPNNFPTESAHRDLLEALARPSGQ
jgi:hypothetical protein